MAAVGCVLAKDRLEKNLKEWLMKKISGIREKKDSETCVIEMLRKPISKDPVLKYVNLILEQEREVMKGI